jgi:hypothetical protein
MARLLIVAGVILIALGVALRFAPWLLNWFGRLPGDIRINTEHTTIFVPIVSMLLLSIVLTVLVNLLKR